MPQTYHARIGKVIKLLSYFLKAEPCVKWLALRCYIRTPKMPFLLCSLNRIGYKITHYRIDQCPRFTSLEMPPSDHAHYSAKFAELINRDLGVATERVLVQFSSPEPTHIGKNGSTIAEIRKNQDN